MMYYFSVCAIISSHKLGDLKQCKSISLQLCWSEVQMGLAELSASGLSQG